MLAFAGVALPFTAVAAGHPFDPGAFSFAIGDRFGIALGLLLGRARRLGSELRTADATLAAVAAQEERTRLACDVHDLVAHSLTVVVLQVGGARRVLRADPAAAEAASVQAERTVKSQVSSILQELGARDRAAAIVLAHEAGWRRA